MTEVIKASKKDLEFLENTQKAQEEYDEGKFIRVKSSQVDKFLDTL